MHVLAILTTGIVLSAVAVVGVAPQAPAAASWNHSGITQSASAGVGA